MTRKWEIKYTLYWKFCTLKDYINNSWPLMTDSWHSLSPVNHLETISGPHCLLDSQTDSQMARV